MEMGGRWALVAREVAETTQDAEALELVRFLDHHVALDIPLAGNRATRFHLTGQSEVLAGLMPVTQADSDQPTNYAEGVYNSTSTAHFRFSNRVIQVKEDIPMSPTFRGLVLLHELKHTKEYTTEHYDGEDPMEFARRERDTFAFEFRLASRIGGEAYEQLLEEATDRQLGFISPEGRINLPLKSGPYDERLDVIFGPALSDKERTTRQTVIWIDSVFRAFDRRFGDKSAEEKSHFIRTLYDASKRQETDDSETS
jgi:hypothetical protein